MKRKKTLGTTVKMEDCSAVSYAKNAGSLSWCYMAVLLLSATHGGRVCWGFISEEIFMAYYLRKQSK